MRYAIDGAKSLHFIRKKTNFEWPPRTPARKTDRKWIRKLPRAKSNRVSRKRNSALDKMISDNKFLTVSKKQSNWHLPEEIVGLLSTIFLVPAIAIIAGMLLPIVTTLTNADPFRLFLCGLAFGAFGVVVLFLARWPLYQQRRFWTFGPRELDRSHRRLYWIAHTFVFVSIVLLLIVWFRVK